MKYCMITNPASGKKRGLKIMQTAIKAFKEHRIQVEPYVSKFKSHPYTLAKETDLKGYDALIVIGGDGTMHEVVNGLMDRDDKIKLPIGLIPGGTGNSLIHDLGTLDLNVAIQHIIERKIMKIDLAKLIFSEGHLYSFNIVGWGLPETINSYAEKWRKIGGQRYNLASLYEIVRNPAWQVIIKLDDTVLEGEFSFFLACNTIFSGNGMRVAPKAILNDGKYDVLVVKHAPRWKLLRLFTRIFSGRHILDPIISYHQVRSFEVIPQKSGGLNVDGQITGKAPFKASVINEAIELII